jgi:hypothetical protein
MIWNWVVSNLPSIGIGVGVFLIYRRIDKFVGSQEQNNRRTRKLVKLHAERHPDDAGYLYDDSRE